MTNQIKVYLSADPGQVFHREILQSPLIKGIRINTGAPSNDLKEKILENFQTLIYPIIPWIDLKCRELRLLKEATIPHEYLELNHKIEVETPVALYYNEGTKYVIVDEVKNGNKLHIKPPDNYTGSETIKFGKGASVNISDLSLKIAGYLTPNDIEYIKAAKKVDLHNYLLSYVESIEDIENLLELDPQANIIAKIESKKGLKFIENKYIAVRNKVRLLAARADLYIELERPHEILEALRIIIQKDQNAIGASRILESFLNLENIPRCTDFTDLGYLMELGYKTFLLGDDLCQNKEALSSALGVLELL